MAKIPNKQERHSFLFKNHRILTFLTLTGIFLASVSGAMASKKCPSMGPRLSVDDYCAKYAGMARRQMQQHGVPASITLAQGILESDYGSSYLAVEANNHFGIKAYSRGWKGAVVYCDDDAANEPFCKFGTVEEGFEYHSTFLLSNTRYARLFKLDVRDYENWAKGLKECGYATNSSYATLLINIIEKYHLDVYDVTSAQVTSQKHQLYVTSASRGLRYVRCSANDDLAVIAKEFGLSERKLRKWNDLLKGATLQEGDIIYLQKKRSKAPRGYLYHTVKAGESMWAVSQRYGVTVNSLMKRNKLVSATVHEGQMLKLR